MKGKATRIAFDFKRELFFLLMKKQLSLLFRNRVFYPNRFLTPAIKSFLVTLYK